MAVSGPANGCFAHPPEIWNAGTGSRELVALADPSSKPTLFIRSDQDDAANDQFCQIKDNMTARGFGRQLRCRPRYFSQMPASWTIELLETVGPAEIRSPRVQAPSYAFFSQAFNSASTSATLARRTR